MTSIANLQIKVDSAEVESATKKLRELKTATNDVAKAEESVRKPRKADQQDTGKLLGQIDRQTKSLDKLANQQRMLNEAHADGKISNEVLSKYNKILEANIELVKSRGSASDVSSAKAQAAAEREIKREQDRQQKADIRAQKQAEVEARRETQRQERDAKRTAQAAAREEKAAARAIEQQEKQTARQLAAEQKALAKAEALKDREAAKEVMRQEREAAATVAQQERAAARAKAQQERQISQQERAAARLAAQQEREAAREVARQEKAAAKAVALKERQDAQAAAQQAREDAKRLAAQERAEAQAAKVREREAAKQLAAEQRAQKQAIADAERAAKQKADAQIKAEKAAAKEQQLVDKQRINSTIQRIRQEQKEEAQAARAEQKKQQQLKNLIAALDPYSRELMRVNELEKKLGTFRSSFNAEQFDRFSQRIAAARKEADRYKDTLDKTGISAKQLRLAQMGLPAQFTDIVVSLQGGMPPLTVLLQQGGQIKDMFGGLGPAIRGVSSAIVGLITPWSVMIGVLAAGVGLWALGASRMDAISKALITSGNAAGTTAGQIRLMAEANAESAGSVRQNVLAITQLAEDGKLLPETYQKVASAVTNMASASGAAVEDLVSDFTSLGKDPVEAAIKLNDKYGFLTASVYRQAQALQDQGREQEAIKLLTNELADVMDSRAERMKEAARGVAYYWNKVKEAVSDTIDAAGAALNPTLETDLANKNKQIEQFGRFLSKEKREESPAYQKLLAERQDIVDSIYEQRIAAYDEGEATRQNRIQIDLENQANKKRLSMMDAVAKAKHDLAQFDARAAEAPNMNPAEVAKTRKVWEDALKKAEKEAKEKLDSKTPKSAVLDSTDANEIGNKINEIKAQYKALDEKVTQQASAGTISLESSVAKRKQLLDDETAKIKSTYEQQIAALEKLKGSKNISANQTISLDNKIADARSKMVVAQEEASRKQEKLSADEELRLKKQTEAVQAYITSLAQMRENLKVAGERERAGLSMSSGEREHNNKLNGEDDRYAEEVRGLLKQKLENPQQAEAIDEQLKEAAKGHTGMKNQIVDNYEKMKAAQMDWTAGVSSSYKQYIEDGQNYAGMTNEVFTNAFSGMEDSMVSFVTTGKQSFGDLTKSILADLARMATRIAMSRALMSILSMYSPSAPAAASMNSATAYNDGMAAAKGAAFVSGTQYFAKGGAFTNSIVNKPTAFSTNGSQNNVMGEAGPEAIMPLTRAADGSLGVRATVDVSGLQQGGGSGVTVYVQIDGQNGGSSSQASDPGYSNFGNEIGQFVDQRYKQLIAKDLQPGGDIWKAQQK